MTCSSSSHSTHRILYPIAYNRFRSAGNNGPALTTVGAPGATHPDTIGVGAAISQAMMRDQYALRERYAAAGSSGGGSAEATPPGGIPSLLPPPGTVRSSPEAFHDRALDTNYTWSSRGPAADAALGVSICAPGGAITCMPTWSLSMNQLMNGEEREVATTCSTLGAMCPLQSIIFPCAKPHTRTLSLPPTHSHAHSRTRLSILLAGTSMSSPNAAGCVALLLSALKADGIPYTPHGVRRALEATAAPLAGAAGPADVFGSGHGMVQVVSAHAHLKLQHAVASARAEMAASGKTAAYPFASPNPAAAAAAASSPASARGIDVSAPTVLPPPLTVTVSGHGAGAGDGADRGVYWRDPGQSRQSSDVAVSVGPQWRKGASNELKVSFQQRLALLPSHPGWISVPSHVLLANGGKEFKAHIDPAKIPSGAAADSHAHHLHGHGHGSGGGSVGHSTSEGVHYAEIAGFEILPPELEDVVAASCADELALLEGRSRTTLAAGLHAFASTTAARHATDAAGLGRVSVALGPALRVPVTVVLPAHPTLGPAGCVFPVTAPEGGSGSTTLSLGPGTLHRRFVAVPQGATWAELTVHRVDGGSGHAAAASTLTPLSQAAHESHLSASSTPTPGLSRSAAPHSGFETGSGGYESGGESSSGHGNGQGVLLSPLPGHPRHPHHADCTATPLRGTPRPSAPSSSPVRQATDGAPRRAAATAAASDASARMIVVHCVQVVRHASPKTAELSAERYMTLRPGDRDAIAFPVRAGLTLEVVVGQFWSSLGQAAVTAEVVFRGVSTDASEVHVSSESGFAPLTVTPLLHDVTLRPVAKLTRSTTYHEPQPGAAVKPLTARDTLITGKRQHALTLTYRIALPEPAKGAKLSLGRVHGVLYESPWDASLVSVANEDGRVVGTSEAFPESLSLPKGDLTVTVQVRHDDAGKLEALLASNGGTLLAVDAPLGDKKAVKLAVSGTHADAVSGGGGGARRARAGIPLQLFVSAPSASSLPKGLRTGSTLTGFILLEDYAHGGIAASASHGAGKDSDGVSLAGRHPCGLPVVYHHHATAAATATASASPSAPPAPPAARLPLHQRLADSVRDSAIAILADLDPLAPPSPPSPATGGGSDVAGGSSAPSPGGALVPYPGPSGSGDDAGASSNEFQRLFSWLSSQYPSHLPLLTARLQAVSDAVMKKAWNAAAPTSPAHLWPSAGAAAEGASSPDSGIAPEARAAVIAAADAVIAGIDAGALAAYFGTRHDDLLPGSDAAKLHAERTSQRGVLVDALWRKAQVQACATLALVRAGARTSEGGIEAALAACGADGFAASVRDLCSWAALSESPAYVLLAIEKALRARQWAVALEVLAKAQGGPRADLKKWCAAPNAPRPAASARLALVTLLGLDSALVTRVSEHTAAALFPPRRML